MSQINVPPAVFRLAPHERNSPTWTAIRRHLADKLEALRKQNDSPDLSDLATARLRGRIAEIKALLEIDQDMPVPE